MQTSNKNRRISPDKWVYISRGLALLSWLLFIVALVVSYYAAPEEQYGLLIYRDVPVRDNWLMPLTNYLYVVLWSSALLSFACLIITRYRSRRRDDSKYFNLILLLITIGAWIAYIFTHTRNS